MWSELGMNQRNGYNAQLMRYADDIVILANRDATIVLGILTELLSELHLKLKAEKTEGNQCTGRIRLSQLPLHGAPSKGHGKQVTYFYPSKRAAERFRSKVCELMKKSIIRLRSVEQVIENLNMLILGWSNHSTMAQPARPTTGYNVF
jgi:hypothetical protein